MGSDPQGTVIIPESVKIKSKVYVVSKIGNRAFCGEKGLIKDQRRKIVKIYIPNTVTSIGKEAFRNCHLLTDVTIPNSVISIGDYAFHSCESLKNITIPNSVMEIGNKAFAECSSLEYVIVPTWYPTIMQDKKIGSKIFDSCERIRMAVGLSANNPEYIYDQLPSTCPYFQNKMLTDFKATAYEKVPQRIAEWQKKKEYETTEQWKQRVTEETRKQKIKEILDEVREEYIANNAPQQITGKLGYFDADYEVYPVEIDGMRTIYAKVPRNEAPKFKENWNTVELKPVYGIIDDMIGVLSCEFKLGDKTYKSVLLCGDKRTKEC